MELYWEPLEEDVGGELSNMTFVMPWVPFTDVIVGANPLYSLPRALRLAAYDSPGAGSIINRGFIITSVNGVSLTSLEFPLNFYVEFRAVGESSDGGLIVASDQNSAAGFAVASAVSISRNTSDFNWAARQHLNSSSRSTVFGGTYAGITRNLVDRRMEVFVSETKIVSKVWEGADPEPSTPQIDENQAFSRKFGPPGFMRYRAASTTNFTLDIYKLGIGTDGDTAPRSPVSGRRRPGLMLGL
jgi:hypothetical protein